jgi:hypothetical protein
VIKDRKRGYYDISKIKKHGWEMLIALTLQNPAPKTAMKIIDL